MKALSFVLLFLTLLPICLRGDEPPPPKTLDELKAAISKILEEGKIPGAAIAVVTTSGEPWVQGFGVSDLAAKTPVTTQTLFRIGSISKGFVALTCLKLQEQGRLDLNDPLDKWLPEVKIDNPWQATDPVRLVHLLEHTSGLADLSLQEFAHNTENPIPLSEALQIAPHQRIVRWRPGSRSSYSNVGPGLLGRVIEHITGERFEDTIAKLWFKSLGMSRATYLKPSPPEVLTQLYFPRQTTPLPYWNIALRAAGSINASAEDMARYVRFYLQRGVVDGQALLTPASLARMERGLTLPSTALGVTTHYGLYSGVNYTQGWEFHGHQGAVEGAVSEFSYSTELGGGFAVMLNTNDGGYLWRLTQLLRSYVIQQQVAPKPPEPVALKDELKQRYSGYFGLLSPRYAGAMAMTEYYGTLRRVVFDGTGFTFKPLLSGWPDHVQPSSETTFRRDRDRGVSYAFLQGEDGGVVLQCDQGTWGRTSGWKVWGVLAGLIASVLLCLSSIVFAPIWGVRMAAGKIPKTGPLSLRFVPFAGCTALLLFEFLLLQSGAQGITVLGARDSFTLWVFAATLAIPVLTAASVFTVWVHRKADMNRGAFWHAVLVTLALVYISVFLGSWGMIGLRLWA